MKKVGNGDAPMAFSRLQVCCTPWDYVTTQNCTCAHTYTHTKRPLTQGYPEDLRVKGSLRDIQSENSHGCGREWWGALRPGKSPWMEVMVQKWLCPVCWGPCSWTEGFWLFLFPPWVMKGGLSPCVSQGEGECYYHTYMKKTL